MKYFCLPKIIFFLILGSVSLSFPQLLEKGTRITIPQLNIEKAHFKPNTIRVKFDRSTTNQIQTGTRNERVKEKVIKEFNSFTDQFNIQSIKPIFQINRTYTRDNTIEKRHKSWGLDQWYDIEIASDSVIAAIKEFSKLPGVITAEPVYDKVQYNDNSLKIPNDEFFKKQWHYHNTGQSLATKDADIDLPEAWKYESGFEEIIVAIVDGGIDITHPDIKANLWKNNGYNFVTKSPVLTPDGHGTHVAGIVGAVSDNRIGISGIAGGTGTGDGIRLMSCQIFTQDSSGGNAEALIWAADNGAAIAQNSWGYRDSLVYNQSDLDAIDYFKKYGGGNFLDHGAVFFAAGNSNKEGAFYPGCYEEVIAVAATNDYDVKASYSNYGDWVDISAPGGERSFSGVYSTDLFGKYRFRGGTSMACPHVSGTAALLISYAARNNITLTLEELTRILKESADSVFTGEYQGKMGVGRLNAGNAMSLLHETHISTLLPPCNISAKGVATDKIALTWELNKAEMSVLVTASQTRCTTKPVKGHRYKTGDKIGESKVIYSGNLEEYIDTGYSANDTVYYRIFSIDEALNYSGYRSCLGSTTYFPEKGTANDPYLVNDLHGFTIITEHPEYWDKHFRLTKSINASETRYYNNGKGWTPIGNKITPFTGVFNGGGHTIDSLFINRMDISYTSCWGYVVDGIIDSLGLTNVKFNGSSLTGGIAAKLVNGQIMNSFVTGNISGGSFVGGFVGLLKDAKITNCYAQTTIDSAKQYAGGFAGSSHGSLISNSYCIGGVNAKYSELDFGGFIGSSSGGSENINTYWNKDKSVVKTSQGGLGKTTDEMLTIETYVDWDFDDIWKMPTERNYPKLRWENTGITPIVIDNTKMISKTKIVVKNNPVSTNENLEVIINNVANSDVEIKIFDQLGTIVKQSEIVNTDSPSILFIWDLKNNYNKYVGSGSYKLIAKIKNNDNTQYIYTMIGIRR